MKYRKCQLLCGLLITTLLITPITGCSKSTDNTSEDGVATESVNGENTFAYTDGTEEELVSTIVMGIVESTDGNEVTLSIGGGFGGGQMPSGEAPADIGEKPEGEAGEDGEVPSGDVPTDMGGNMQSATGVLTIADESVIVVTAEDGTTSEGSLADITEGVMLEIEFDATGTITKIAVSSGRGDMAMGGGPGQSASGVDSYTAVVTYTEDTEVEGENFTSSGTDENAILVSSGTVTLKDIMVERLSDDSTGGDNASFYGVGAAVLTTGGTVYVSNAEITTDAAGGAGVFAYGDGVVYVSDSVIRTTQNTSGGIHAAGGGTLYAWDLDVETDGESAAAIRSDRGGGTMVVDGGTYVSNGVGSPAVYCTADIAINNATLTATGSEAICMEGLNTIHLYDCDIIGDMDDLEQNDTTWNIIVYQSMSGDSEIGNSTMQIIGGSITAKNGGLLYTTNTECNILFSGVDITYAEENDFFLMCTGNTNQRGWGTVGSNGSQCTFTAVEQEMEGDIIWDTVSTLDFYMTEGSSLVGAFVNDETYAGNGGEGYCNLYISEDSIWTVTGDSQITALYNAGKIIDEKGNTVSVVGEDGTIYIEGTSEYTITVSDYSETVSLSGAASAAEWSDYEVSRPEDI